MRFYDPEDPDPRPIDAGTVFQNSDEKEAARKCVRMGLVPSVTTVLGTIREEYLERWKMREGIKNYQKCGNIWHAVESIFSEDSPESKFGVEVHDCIHRFLSGKQPGRGQALRHAQPAIRWLAKTMHQPLLSEATLVCTDLGCGGTIDLVIETKNRRRLLGDIKVVKMRSQYPAIPPLQYRCQLSAYREMIRNKHGWKTDRISLYLASPFGDLPEPKLLTFPYQRDYLPEFEAAKTLWLAQFGTSVETLENTNQDGEEGLDIQNYRHGP